MPRKNIPPEYFLKVREPQIQQRRDTEAKAKRARVEAQVKNYSNTWSTMKNYEIHNELSFCKVPLRSTFLRLSL